MLSDVLLNVVMLSVIVLNVIMLSILGPQREMVFGNMAVGNMIVDETVSWRKMLAPISLLGLGKVVWLD